MLDNPEPVAYHEEAVFTISQIEELVYASLAADSLSLGPHWIYDSEKIRSIYPDGISSLDQPHTNFHPGKSAGDFTHYGDQTLILLESLAERKEWSVDRWFEDWTFFWDSNPQSYADKATRETLAKSGLGRPTPSTSSFISAVSRMAPLLVFMDERALEDVVTAAREQVGITHGDESVPDSAEFFTRSIYLIGTGISFLDSFETAANDGQYIAPLGEMISAAKNAIGNDIQETATDFGLSCSVYKAFSLTIWLALTFEDNPKEMLVQNAMLGGDSSARGMILGMLIAAQGNYQQLPSEWTQGLNQLNRVKRAFELLESETNTF